MNIRKRKTYFKDIEGQTRDKYVIETFLSPWISKLFSHSSLIRDNYDNLKMSIKNKIWVVSWVCSIVTSSRILSIRKMALITIRSNTKVCWSLWYWKPDLCWCPREGVLGLEYYVSQIGRRPLAILVSLCTHYICINQKWDSI